MPPKKRSRKYPAQRQPTTTAVAPPTKARVVANGMLKLLVEMPLDILYEVGQTNLETQATAERVLP